MLHGGRGVQTRRMTRVHTFQSVEQMLARRALPRSTAAAGRPSPRSTTKPAGGGAQQQIIGQGASEPVEGGGEAARPGRFWPVPPTPSTSASSGSAGASASPGTVTGEAAPDAARHSSLIDMDAEGRGTKGRKVKGKMGDEVFTRQGWTRAGNGFLAGRPFLLKCKGLVDRSPKLRRQVDRSHQSASDGRPFSPN
jgi:hypothetical protein